MIATLESTQPNRSAMQGLGRSGSKLDTDELYRAFLNDFGLTGSSSLTRFEMQHLRTRYHDPRTGRFNRLDPWKGQIATPQSLNKYAYGENNPVLNADPTGLFSLANVTVGVSIGSLLTGAIMSAIGGATGSTNMVVGGFALMGFGAALAVGASAAPVVASGGSAQVAGAWVTGGAVFGLELTAIFVTSEVTRLVRTWGGGSGFENLYATASAQTRPYGSVPNIGTIVLRQSQFNTRKISNASSISGFMDAGSNSTNPSPGDYFVRYLINQQAKDNVSIMAYEIDQQGRPVFKGTEILTVDFASNGMSIDYQRNQYPVFPWVEVHP